MRTVLLLLAAAAAVLTSCASPAGDPGATGSGDAGPASPAAPGDELAIELDRGDGSPVEELTLACGGTPSGSHPDAAAACEHLAAMDAPFEPLPADVVCTEQYGGPQTARITGTWGGEPVDLELSRTDGCRISQWDSLGPVLPGPVGVEPPG